MRLLKVRVREFWSVQDSQDFDIGDITCLVGKNESGKTALLQALYRLNPINDPDGNFDVTDDYPRANVTEYEKAVENGRRTPAIVVEAKFRLDDAELGPVREAFGNGVLSSPELTLSKGYENRVAFLVHVDEKAVGRTLIERARLSADVGSDVWDNLSQLAALLEERAEAQRRSYDDAVAAANKLTDADEKKGALNEAQSLQETTASQNLRASLKSIVAAGLANHVYETFLKAHVPKFLYFDEYYRMRGCENIDALQLRITNKNLKPSDHPLLGLIELAGLKLPELVSPNRTRELVNKLEGAGNHLTKQILKYWSQNRYLQLKFDVRPARPGDPQDMRSGTNIWGTVYDSKHYVTTDLGSRSRGFVWFFSFLAWYSRWRGTQQIILLLDEPGLSLHGRAQEDLLRYFEEELRPHHQLIYTTHSPFMVDPQHFDRVRIVQDRGIDTEEELPADAEGTKVLTNVLDATGDSLFPLQGALGYEIYQTLFVGPNSLVVEGVSDLLYLQAISGLLTASGREGLDSRWTITPVGGADKVPTFVALLGAQHGLNVATLIDIQKGHAQMIENLYKRKLLSKSHVLTFADFTAKSEADIEDMFEIDFYLQLVNQEYERHLAQPVSANDLNLGPPRILQSLEGYIADHPLKGAAVFGHYRPARFFVENVASLSPRLSEATLQRFEAAFKKLNSLL